MFRCSRLILLDRLSCACPFHADKDEEAPLAAAAPCSVCGAEAVLPHMNCANIDVSVSPHLLGCLLSRQSAPVRAASLLQSVLYCHSHKLRQHGMHPCAQTYTCVSELQQLQQLL